MYNAIDDDDEAGKTYCVFVYNIFLLFLPVRCSCCDAAAAAAAAADVVSRGRFSLIVIIGLPRPVRSINKW